MFKGLRNWLRHFLAFRFLSPNEGVTFLLVRQCDIWVLRFAVGVWGQERVLQKAGHGQEVQHRCKIISMYKIDV